MNQDHALGFVVAGTLAIYLLVLALRWPRSNVFLFIAVLNLMLVLIATIKLFFFMP